MATLYAKLAGGNASAAGTWSNVSSAGVDNSGPPANGDDVIFDVGSGNVVIDANTNLWESLTMTGYTGTMSGTFAINIKPNTVTKAVVLAGTITWTGALQVSANTTVTLNVTTNGKTISSINIGNTGAGIVYLLDNTTVTGAVTHNNGIFHSDGSADNSGLTHAWGSFLSTNSNARTITLGNSSITLSASGSAWNTSVVTNLTFTSTTATVTLSQGSAGFNAAGFTYTGLNLVYTNNGSTVFGSSSASTITLGSLTRTASAVKTDNIAFNCNCTTTGTTTLSGNSAINRLFVFSNTIGTSITLTAATVVSNGADFRDITGAGAGSWDLSAAALYSGDAGGNSGITFTTPASQSWFSNSGGNWSANIWTSRVPLPQDDANITSHTMTAQTITLDMPRAGKSIAFTGTTGCTFTAGSAWSLFGSLTIASGVTVGGGGALTFEGRSSYTFTTAGKTFAAGSIGINAPSGTITQQDALTWSGAGSWCTPCFGTWSTNGFNVTGTSTGGQMSTATPGTLTITNSTITVARGGSGNAWNIAVGNTLNASGSIIIIATASGNSRNFVGAGKTYGTLQYNVALSPGPLVISGANTFATLNIGDTRTLTLQSAVTQTVATWTGTGVSNGYVYQNALDLTSVSTLPDAAAQDITGDIDLRARVAADDWTPALNQCLITKWFTPNLSYAFRFDPAGTLALFLTTDGTSAVNTTSSVSTGFTDGTTNWVRVTWRQSDGRVQFFTASGALTNPVSADFTQLGTDKSIVLASIFSGTAGVAFGALAPTAGSQLFGGKYYRAQIRNGIDGTVVADVDFTSKTVGANTFTESSAQAATVTISGFAQQGDGRLELNALTGASAATISKSGANIAGNYIMVTDNTVTGVTPAYAGPNGILRSNTTNWQASNPGQGNQMLLLTGVGG